MTHILTKEEEESIGTRIAINSNTLLSVLQGVKIEKNMKAEVRDTETFKLLLGCIGMALTIQAELALVLADKSTLVLAKNLS